MSIAVHRLYFGLVKNCLAHSTLIGVLITVCLPSVCLPVYRQLTSSVYRTQVTPTGRVGATGQPIWGQHPCQRRTRVRLLDLLNVTPPGPYGLGGPGGSAWPGQLPRHDESRLNLLVQLVRCSSLRLLVGQAVLTA